MYCYGFAFVPVNFLFLLLGFGLLVFAAQQQIALPGVSDEILPFLASNYLGNTAFILFSLGIVAAAFSSADSALAALTTSFSIDILNINRQQEKKAVQNRRIIHVGISAVFALMIILIKTLNSSSAINVIYTAVSYTYGPLLGMFIFSLFTKRSANDRAMPYIAVFAPVFCFFLNWLSAKCFSYSFGYELLMMNGMITFVLMLAWGKQKKQLLTNT
jgi:Na+/proline symporter